MVNARVSESFINRRSMIWMAWGLLAISVLMPAPAGSFANGAYGISAFYVLGKAVVWSEALPGSGASLGFLRGALVALAAFSNIAFVCASFLRDQLDASMTWKGFLLVALALDAIVVFAVPELARLPAYWVWLASIAILAFAFFGFPGRGTASAPTSRKGQPPMDDRGVPAFVWVLLGFTLLWIAVSAGNYARPVDDTDPARDDAPLTRYVTDNAFVLTRDQTTQLDAALDAFEKATSNQVAVAIYRRVPDVSVEAFTIGVAEQSRLGRKGLDNGAILFIFVEQRIARLEVGYGLEGVLTDVESHRILEADLGPALGRGAYFDGVDTTLGKVLGLVKDAYARGRVPSALSVWWHQMRVEVPKLLRNARPMLSRLGLGAKVGITLFGSLLLLALWSALTQWIALVGNIARGIGNLRAGRPFSTGMENVDLGQVWDSVKALAWVLVGIASTLGVVVIAAGGAFGGAGALIHW